MGHLSGTQITGLALWSYGIVFAKACGLSRVAMALASDFGEKESNFRQRLREYGMRSWIEDSFKDLKSDGWQWQNTWMSDPDRAARLWLALSVATLWVVSFGGELDAKRQDCDLSYLPLTHIARKTKFHARKARNISCFARGLIHVLATLIHQRPIVLGRLLPEPWPLETHP